MGRRFKLRRTATAVLAIAATAILAGTAGAAPPSSTSPPTIEGNADIPFIGDVLRGTPGRWNNSPTSYTYQWFRCNASGDRQGCDRILDATDTTYTVQKVDVGHKLHVHVTARNADGSASRDSAQTGIASDQAAPRNYVRPAVSGTTTVGSTLTTTPGTWAGATSISYQWQQCDSAGANCTDINGATGRSYGVRAADTGHSLRAQVTATNKYGSAREVSDRSTAVTTGAATTTTTTTTPRGGGCTASSLKPPARLLIDRWSFAPNVVTAFTDQFTARIHVSEVTGGCSVDGAQLWATAIPYNQTNVAQASTGPDGWATLTFTTRSGFPANPGRQQILAILVRATQPGGSVLAGVSTRRALRQNVRLS